MGIFHKIATNINTIGGGIINIGVKMTSNTIDKKFPETRQYIKDVRRVAVIATAVGILDIVGVYDVAEAAELNTRNMIWDGRVHEITGVPFETNTVECVNGQYTEVFPMSDSTFDVGLLADTLQCSDTMVYIGIANMMLYEVIQNDSSLAVDLGFEAQGVENLQSAVTSEGYDWRYHEELGRMQLVDQQGHGMTVHTGGRNLWEGETLAR